MIAQAMAGSVTDVVEEEAHVLMILLSARDSNTKTSASYGTIMFYHSSLYDRITK
jgi:hypothetical protein